MLGCNYAHNSVAFLKKMTGEHLRKVILLWFIIAQFGLIVWRIMLRKSLRFIRRKGRNTKTYAIAGAGDLEVKSKGGTASDFLPSAILVKVHFDVVMTMIADTPSTACLPRSSEALNNATPRRSTGTSSRVRQR